MAKVIGLTGGIGSGKTTVATIFKEFGIPIYIADLEAKKIMQYPEVIEDIKLKFGDSIFDEGVLNRSKLASIVFNNREKLDVLNKIIHPQVKNDFEIWLKKNEKFQYVIYEAAILFESGRYKECDYIITVTAPVEVRIQRVVQRDKTTPDAILDRMKMQWNDAQRSEKSNFIIDNVDLSIVKQEIVKILKILNFKQNPQ